MGGPRLAKRAGPFWALVLFSALSMAQSALNLLLLPLYVRFIDPAEFGVLSAVTIMAAIVSVVSNFKLDAAMRTFYFDHSGDGDKLEAYLQQIFSASMFSAVLVFLVMLLLGDGLFHLVFAHEELRFFPAGALALASASIGVCLSPYFVYLRNALRLRELVRWQALLSLGTVACQSVLVIVYGLGMYGVLLGSLLPAAAILVSLCLVRTELLTWRLRWRALAPSLGYGAPLVVLGIFYALGTRLDRLVLERSVDLDVLGSYAIVASLFGLLTVVLNALDNAIRPYFYPQVRAGGRTNNGVVELYQKLYLVVGLLALSCAVFLGSTLGLFTAKPAYLAARAWMPLGATAFAPVILTRYFSLHYELRKRSLALSAAVALRIGVSFALLVVLVPKLGIAGVFLAILSSEMLNALAFGLTARRLFGIQTSFLSTTSYLAVFLGGLWLLALTVGARSLSVFGALQLLVTAGALFFTNRRVLWSLRVSTDDVGSVAAGN